VLCVESFAVAYLYLSRSSRNERVGDPNGIRTRVIAVKGRECYQGEGVEYASFLVSDPPNTATTTGSKVRISEIHWNIASISTRFLVDIGHSFRAALASDLRRASIAPATAGIAFRSSAALEASCAIV
jgi:hypothetical protein